MDDVATKRRPQRRRLLVRGDRGGEKGGKRVGHVTTAGGPCVGRRHGDGDAMVRRVGVDFRRPEMRPSGPGGKCNSDSGSWAAPAAAAAT